MAAIAGLEAAVPAACAAIFVAWIIAATRIARIGPARAIVSVARIGVASLIPARIAAAIITAMRIAVSRAMAHINIHGAVIVADVNLAASVLVIELAAIASIAGAWSAGIIPAAAAISHLYY